VYGTEKENDYRILIGTSEEKETLERSGHIGKMISMDVDWIYLAQDRSHCQAVLNRVTKFPAA